MTRVAIIGGGLAGTACAWTLRRAGLTPVLFEASDNLAAGASGNSTGIFNPRFSAGRTAESDFYASAYALAIRAMKELAESHGIAFSQHGSLHLANSDDKVKRFKSVLDGWGWRSDHMRGVEAEEASKIAGVPVGHDALFLPDSGSVSPAALCAAYAQGIDVRLNTPADGLEQVENGWRVAGEDFDAVVLACGAGVKWFEQTRWLPVHTVRGQIVQIEENTRTEDIRCNVCYGGYITPSGSGKHVVGSTFQKWLDHTDVLEEDNAEIIGRLENFMPSVQGTFHASDARAGLRTAAQDRFPVIGRVPDLSAWQGGAVRDIPNLYVSTAHGSHGIVSSIAGAQLIADEIAGGPKSLANDTIGALNGARFLERAQKRGVLASL